MAESTEKIVDNITESKQLDAESTAVEATEVGIGMNSLEFRFLCASYAIESVVCFEMPETIAETEEEQLQTLLNMVKRGILYQDDNCFVVNEEIGNMLDCIANRTATLRIWSPESDIKNCCIYVGADKECVIAEPGKKEDEFLVLKQIPEGTLASFLASGNLIPEAMVKEGISEISRELKNDELSVPVGALENENGLRLEIEIYEGLDTEKSVAIYVLWIDERELIVRDVGENRTADYYVTKELIPMICEMCGIENSALSVS